jgi:hypothetical protein
MSDATACEILLTIPLVGDFSTAILTEDRGSRESL